MPSEGPHSGNLRLLKVGCCTARVCGDRMPAEHLWCKPLLLKSPDATVIIVHRRSALQGIDGAFRPGVLTALMGASGAGKTVGCCPHA